MLRYAWVYISVEHFLPFMQCREFSDFMNAMVHYIYLYNESGVPAFHLQWVMCAVCALISTSLLK